MDVITKKLKLNPSTANPDPEALLYYNVHHPSEKIQCVFCDKEITRHTKLIDGEELRTTMCVSCFIDGKQNSRHPAPTTFQILNKLNFPLYEDTWTAEEEVLLMEGMEKYGFGNWGDIADHLATDKTPEDLLFHYERVFIDNSELLPPEDVMSKRDAKNNLVVKTGDGAGKNFSEVEGKRKKGTKYMNEKKGSLNPGQKVQGGLQAKDSGTNAGEIVGYMPLRADFDYEYDNEAELFLAELEFNGKVGAKVIVTWDR